MTAELFSKIAWHVIERNMHEGKQLDLLARLVNLEGFDQMDTVRAAQCRVLVRGSTRCLGH